MKRILLATSLIVFVIFVLLELFLESAHGHVVFPWSHVAGFFSLFGLIGCLALMGFAKLIGHYWLQRKEDYYDKSDDNE